MKQLCTKIILAMLISMMSIQAFAHDIEVRNADGVTIYYNYINDGKELEVTYNTYSGSVVIPEEVTYMNRIRKVTSIGNSAFITCSRLTSVTIGNSVTSIGSDAFYGCSGLTSVTIGNSVTSIGSDAFFDCSGLTSVTIPNSVTSIGGSAFYGCSGLTSVTIPNSVTSIGDGAFKNCSGLTSVTIGNSVTSIGNSAFSSCSGLTSVTIGNSVTSIGSNAFYGCSGLTSVTIGNSVTSIGGAAFSGCSGLTSVTIPNSVTSIGERAFWSWICQKSFRRLRILLLYIQPHSLIILFTMLRYMYQQVLLKSTRLQMVGKNLLLSKKEMEVAVRLSTLTARNVLRPPSAIATVS